MTTKRARTHRRSLGSLLAAALVLSPISASAETLADALTWAYQTSPQLKISRSALRAADEGVRQAGAGKKLQLNGVGVVAATTSNNAPRDITDTYRAQLIASLNLYDGGQTEAAVQSAIAAVEAARAQLVIVEQNVLLGAVAAYVDVRRDARFMNLAENNVKVISQQVEAARDRFEVGEVTRTDVSQATARLASARSNLAANNGAFERSLQAYLVAIGREAGRLAPPPALPKLPASLAAAQSIARKEHPSIKAAQASLRSAEFDVVRARGAKKPSLTLGANVTYGVNTQVYGQETTSAGIDLNGNIPILDGGRNDSLIRQALSVLDRRKAELQDAARVVVQDTALAWSNLDVARASIIANRQQIRAAQIAFEGIQEEAKLGARTTLDVLDAEQEVLNAQSNLASAERDEYVAAYNLVAAMGLLTTRYLNLPVEEYDPNVYYQSVNGSPPTRESTALGRISDRWSN